MGIYDTYVLPHLIGLACGGSDVAKQREKVVPHAHGRVLEVGMGPGLNLPFYDRSNVELIWGLEPSKGMRRKAAAALQATDLDVRCSICLARRFRSTITASTPSCSRTRCARSPTGSERSRRCDEF